MMIAHGGVVAVADGEHLKIYRNDAREPELKLQEIDYGNVPDANASSGGRHVSTSANPGLSQQNEDNFAAGVADVLKRLVPQVPIEQLFIIAAPRTLGELRKHLDKQVEAVVAAEISKDLTGRPIKEIEEAVLAL